MFAVENYFLSNFQDFLNLKEKFSAEQSLEVKVRIVIIIRSCQLQMKLEFQLAFSVLLNIQIR